MRLTFNHCPLPPLELIPCCESFNDYAYTVATRCTTSSGFAVDCSIMVLSVSSHSCGGLTTLHTHTQTNTNTNTDAIQNGHEIYESLLLPKAIISASILSNVRLLVPPEVPQPDVSFLPPFVPVTLQVVPVVLPFTSQR